MSKMQQYVFREVPVLLLVTSFCGLAKQKCPDQKHKHFVNRNNIFEIPLPLFLLIS